MNGKRVGDGPARGDLTHWRYERFDLAPYLHTGHNLITATVWNFGILAPVAQMTDRTAFLLESEVEGPTNISTPKDWLVEVEPGQRPLGRDTVTLKDAYYASGPGEEIDASKYDWNWNSANSWPELGCQPPPPCATASFPAPITPTPPTPPATIPGASSPMNCLTWSIRGLERVVPSSVL